MSGLTSPGPDEPLQSILVEPEGGTNCLGMHRVTEYFFQLEASRARARSLQDLLGVKDEEGF